MMRKAIAIWLLLYSASNGAVTGFWKLDDNAASTTVVATTGANAALEGGDNTADKQTAGPGGTITYAFNLNGTDDAIDISGTTISPTGVISVSLWVKPDHLTDNRFFARAADNRYITILDSTTIRVNTTGGNSDFTVPEMSAGTWYHILVVRSSNTFKVWLNSEASASNPSDTNTGSLGVDRIGRSGSLFFDGAISQVRVYDSDESANVATLYAEGVSSGIVISPLSGLIAPSSTVRDPLGQNTIP